MAFNIPTDALEALKEKPLSASAEQKIDDLKLSEADSANLESILTLIESFSETLPKEDEKIVNAMAEVGGFKVPVIEKEVKVPVEAEVDPLEDLPDNIKAHFDAEMTKMKSTIEAANTEKQAALDELKAERDQRILESFELKAKAFSFIPGMNEKELAKVLMDISYKSPESYSQIEKAMNGLKAMIEDEGKIKLMMDHVGSSVPAPGSAEGKIEARIKEIRAADPKIGYEKAKLQVVNENPNLYQEMINEGSNKGPRT